MNVIYQIPQEVLEDLRSTNNQILEALKILGDAKAVGSPQFLTRKEFMKEAKIGETLMHELISKGKIKFHRAGKKLIRIPYAELLRFQRGEVQ